MKRLFLFFSSLLIVCNLSATISLPFAMSDNMVLQQRSRAVLWGWAEVGSVIEVSTTWSSTAVSDTIGEDHFWRVPILTRDGSYNAHIITIKERGANGEILSEAKLYNVLIGEVWFASGQSNMEMTLNGFWACPVKGSNEEIAQADCYRNKVRMLYVPKAQAYEPQENVPDCTWMECSTENAPAFSAVGYFFAQHLNSVLNVPVGIICCAYGGSTVESWLPREILEGYGMDLSPATIEKEPTTYLWPLVKYNAMLYPLRHFTIRGFIWYQGESNVANYKTYTDRFTDMVAHWRELWRDRNNRLPFYFVEIAPHDYGDPMADNAARLREAQYRAQSTIPNSAMVGTNDLVQPFEIFNIHPMEKREVGRRLSYMALNQTYGYTNIACKGPEYKSVRFKERKAWLTFDNAPDSFSRMIDIQGFELAGENKVFYPAEATVNYDNNQIRVVLSSPKVKYPIAVRYCFRNFQIGNMANTRYLPMIPFRTDQWR